MGTKKRPSTRSTQVAVLVAFLLATAALLARTIEALPRGWLNADYVELNHGLADRSPARIEHAIVALTADSQTEAIARRAWRGVGLAYVALGRLDDATLAWEQVPDSRAEFAAWALAMERAGNWPAAQAWHWLSVRADPADGDQWYRLGQAAAASGDAVAAAGHYAEALAAPRRQSFGRSDIQVRLAELAKNDTPPDWAGALAFYEEAIRQDDFLVTGDQLNARFGRAEALDKLDRPGEALDAYRSVVAGWPNHYWANVHSGRLTWSVEGDATRAAGYLRHAIAIDARSKWAYLFLADVYTRSGTPAAAVPLLRQVLTIDPTDEGARRQLDRLTDGHDS